MRRWGGYCALVFMFVLFDCSRCHGQTPQGLARTSGEHITIISDIGDSQKLAEFAKSFDTATGQWREFWNLPTQSLDGWHVTAHIMRDKSRFRSSGHLPRSVPDFPFGYALGDKIWVVEQQSDYYTRHLLLHEGVHALMFRQFGGAGPSWFMEGTAELLGVHQSAGSDVKINRVPVSRESVPYWGRFKLLAQRRGENKTPSLKTVMDYPRDLNADVELYGWSWAAIMLLSRYDDTANSLQSAARRARDTSPRFNLIFHRELQNRWPILCARWHIMCQTLDYGFDWDRERVTISMDDPLWDSSPASIQVAADRGWQSMGARLKAGTKIRLHPSGHCELASDPKPWISQPNGVTIRYYRGRPLGQLIAMFVPNAPTDERLLKPFDVFAIEKDTEVTVKQDSWLLFRINDAIGELGDNRRAYTIEIK